jgi:hypothetical protein
LPVSFISLRFERVDNLGAYRIPPETGILIPSDFDSNQSQLSPAFLPLVLMIRPVGPGFGF